MKNRRDTEGEERGVDEQAGEESADRRAEQDERRELEQEREAEAELRPIEAWAQERELAATTAGAGGDRQNPDHWKFVAAKARRRWQPGQAVSEEDFDEAIAEVEGSVKSTIR